MNELLKILKNQLKSESCTTVMELSMNERKGTVEIFKIRLISHKDQRIFFLKSDFGQRVETLGSLVS